jgi:membrane protein
MDFAKSLKHYAGGLWRRSGEHDTMFMAGALSFSVLVCIVPFVLIVFSIGGLVLERSAFTQQIDTFIDVVIPYAETARFVKQIVAAQAGEFRIYKNLAGAVGVAGLLFASSVLFSTVRTIFDRIYKSDRTRSLIVGKLHDLGMIVLVMVLFFLSASILPMVPVLEHFAGEAGSVLGVDLPRLKPIILDAVTVLTVFVSLFLVHLLVPSKRPSKGAAFVAALSTTVLWVIAEHLFGAYIAHVASFRKIYGAYVLGIVVFFWIHYSSVVFILGAEIGQLFREWYEKKG